MGEGKSVKIPGSVAAILTTGREELVSLLDESMSLEAQREILKEVVVLNREKQQLEKYISKYLLGELENTLLHIE